MKKIVIIGLNSYLAIDIEKCLSENNELLFLSHLNWEEHLHSIENSDYVINFCVEPNFATHDIELNKYIDFKIAKSIENTNTKFTFISSRKVYGSSDKLTIHNECDELLSYDKYSKNKIKLETALTDLLGDRLLVLRISNVIGSPVNRSEYKTFVGWISNSLIAKRKLVVNQNIDSLKDFVTKEYIHKSISLLIEKNASGIYNLSSGFGTSVRTILEGYVDNSLIEYKKNNILNPSDQFILDNSKLVKLTKLPITTEDIKNGLKKYKIELEQLLLSSF